MKKVIKNIKKGTLIVGMIATMASNAIENPSIALENDLKRTYVYIENVKAGNQLSIIDFEGVILHKEQIVKTGDYTRGYDFTALPDGEYSFQLDKDVEIRMIPFTVKSNTVLFNKKEETTIYKPLILVEGDYTFVSKLALDLEPVTIKVYYQDTETYEYNLIHTDEVKDLQTVERVYKLENMENINYKVVVSTKEKEFTKYINK